ncbi:MAG: carbohydrate binding domain-containing protein [Candidatus Bathyarchaeia archaeon]|jgi:hypothetical protein
MGLIGLWLNLNSPVIGFLNFLLYFIPNIIFTGNVFFRNESTAFRFFYGTALFLALVSVSGSLIYLLFDFSNNMIVLSLSLLSGILTFLALKTRSCTGDPKCSCSSSFKPHFRLKLPPKIDLLYLILVFICFYLLYSVHTRESLKSVLDVMPVSFFVSFFLATAILIYMISSARRKTTTLLLYIILLVAIPTSIYLLIFIIPVEPVSWINIVWARHLAEYGRFVSDPGQIEVASSLIHKQLPYLGLNVIVVILSKFLNIDPMFTSLVIPIFFFTYIPVTCYIQAKHCTGIINEKFALLAAVLVLFSQHTVFLVIPPLKGETFALVFLFIGITFWIKYIQTEKLLCPSLFVALTFTMVVVLIHQWVGQFALIAAVLSIYLHKFRPFAEGCKTRIKSKLALMGLILLSFLCSISMILVYYLTSIVTPKVFSFSFNPDVSIHQLFSLIFPNFWINNSLSFWGQVFYGYLNNFSYILYLFLALGLIVAIRRRANLNWVCLVCVLVVVSFMNMLITGGLLSVADESAYRSFYCLNLISTVLTSLGLYFVMESATKLRVGFTFYLFSRFKKKLVFKSFSFLFVLVISLTIVSSVYGGLPRVNSVGPYNAQSLRYISEYDFEAAQFIKNVEGDWSNNFYVFGDLFTSSAFLSEFGAKTFVTSTGNYLFVSERPFSAEPWQLYLKTVQPSKESDVFYPLNQIMNLTGAKTVFIVLTYRLEPQSNFRFIVDTYTKWLGEPIFEISDKLYIFAYQQFQLVNPVFLMQENNQTLNEWLIERYGSGNMDLSLTNYIVDQTNATNFINASLTAGPFGRFTLRYVFPQVQNWSAYDFLFFNFLGNSSEATFNIVIRGQSVSDYYSYNNIKDDAEGWRKIIIPFDLFADTGSPSWSSVRELLVQINYGWQPNSTIAFSDFLVDRHQSFSP